jgi:hypothetical protein
MPSMSRSVPWVVSTSTPHASGGATESGGTDGAFARRHARGIDGGRSRKDTPTIGQTARPEQNGRARRSTPVRCTYLARRDFQSRKSFRHEPASTLTDIARPPERVARYRSMCSEAFARVWFPAGRACRSRKISSRLRIRQKRWLCGLARGFRQGLRWRTPCPSDGGVAPLAGLGNRSTRDCLAQVDLAIAFWSETDDIGVACAMPSCTLYPVEVP